MKVCSSARACAVKLIPTRQVDSTEDKIVRLIKFGFVFAFDEDNDRRVEATGILLTPGSCGRCGCATCAFTWLQASRGRNSARWMNAREIHSGLTHIGQPQYARTTLRIAPAK